ncbi:hypothetical protein [Bacillus xiapuensis]|uniref:DUF4871 domain-containing protein n=1 Tax=Bacillus xiapuensis TaxID=2014075 RepID=A0ABU6N6A5_9BACI|nr:hypothetical protein [Bacillus xiapuensis]
MKRIPILWVLFSILIVLVACSSKETVNEKIKKIVLPKDIPTFVKESDFANIDWDKKAVKFGERSSIFGNENKSGVIGVDMPSLNGQKWMWHLWGVDDADLTVVGFHKELQTVHKILVNGWTIHVGGPNNGADSHAPSAVKIPKSGEWAILLYTNGKFFDTLVYDIKE